MKVRFKQEVEAPVIKISGAGGYSREFKREEQPFEATELEAAVLESSGLFETVPEPLPFAAAEKDAA